MTKQSSSQQHPGTLASYTTGYVLSIILTLMAAIIVVNHTWDRNLIIAVIMTLASVQLIVQLIFFLHLGREKKPRWNLAAFFFMLIVLVIIVAGSVWIMYSLNYNMNMSPSEMDKYMQTQGNKGF